MNTILYLSTLILGAVTLPLDDASRISVPGIQKRIVGGQIAVPHQFPYNVGIRLIRQKDDVEYTSWCGGSLISDRVALTAGHCMDNTVRVLLHFATHNRWEKVEADRVVVEVKKENFRVYETYTRKYMNDDIALILLPEPVKLSEKITVVSLPRRSESDLIGRTAIATGWGSAGFKIGASEVLRFVPLRIMNNDKCLNFGTLKPSQLCTDGSEIKSTCNGDSGGPLVVEEADGTKTVVGITSFGASSCEEGYPAVFTRVSSYLDWIHKQTGIKIRD